MSTCVTEAFRLLAEHYLKADFGADAVRPKSVNTTEHVACVVRKYLVPRFGDEIANDVRPLEIQRWLKSLHSENGLAWTPISKMRGIMRRIYKVGIVHGHVSRNPVEHVETRSKTNYRAIVITPQQTLATIDNLHPRFTPYWCLHAPRQRFALLRHSRCAGATFCGRKVGSGCASAGPREQTGNENRCVGRLRPDASDPCRTSSHIARADALCEGIRFVFPSFRARGRVPLPASVFVADHLRPAAKKAGAQIEDGQRFGLHNLRHSLSNWLVNKAKIEPKTVQGILRHSKIQTTLDLYTQEDGDEARVAQGKYLMALKAATQVLQ